MTTVGAPRTFGVEEEYLLLETSTPICHESNRAEASLVKFRTILSQEARSRGVVLAGTGLPPVGGNIAGTVAPKQR